MKKRISEFNAASIKPRRVALSEIILRAQQTVRQYVSPGRSLVKELLEETVMAVIAACE